MNKTPNVLWILTDEQRNDSVSYINPKWARTKTIDKIANESVIFESAYTSSPVCIPARASMLSGKAPSSIGVLNNHHWFNHEIQEIKFLTEPFIKNGYNTASFGKHHYACPVKAFPLEGGKVLGDKVHYFKYKDGINEKDYDVVKHKKNGEEKWILGGIYPDKEENTPEHQNIEEAINWLKKQDTSKPFFLRVSLNAPHTPVSVPKPYNEMIVENKITLPIDFPNDISNAMPYEKDNLFNFAGSDGLSEEEIKKCRKYYYAEVAFVDNEIKILIDYLKRTNLYDNTIIAFVSDHGTLIGEHGLFQKQNFYEAAVTVPFFIKFPNSDKCKRIKEPVSTSSLLPTLFEIAGLEIPDHTEYDSLLPNINGEIENTIRPVFSEIDYGLRGYRQGDRRIMIRKGKWKLSLFRDPKDKNKFVDSEERELYNLKEDAFEKKNLALTDGFDSIMEDLINDIDEWDSKREIIDGSLTGSFI